MILFKPIPPKLLKRYDSWVSQRDEWLERAKVSEGYYYSDIDRTGTTYTKKQVENIEATTNIPVNINLIYPNANQKLAILMQTDPSLKVISTDGKAVDEATVLDKCKHGVMVQSDMSIQTEEFIKDQLIAGMGGLHIGRPSFYRPGEFNTRIEWVNYENLVLDPDSKQRTLGDQRGYFIIGQEQSSTVLKDYGKILSKVTDQNGEKVPIETYYSSDTRGLSEDEMIQHGEWEEEGIIFVRQYFEKVYTKVHIIEDKNGDMKYVFEEDLDPEDYHILQASQLSYEDIFIRKWLMLGDFLVNVETLPINDYPTQIGFYEWGKRPYRSYSMVHFVKPMQEAFDKLIQMFILNGILTNNAGWTSPKGAIAPEDKLKWENSGNNPMVIKEYDVILRGDKPFKPEKEVVPQLSSFYPMVLELIKNSIEYSTGINAILSGDPKDAKIDVFSSLQQYQSAAMQRIILATKHHNGVMERLGNVLIQQMIANLKPNQNFAFFDESGKLNEVKIARDIANSVKLAKFKVIAIPAVNMPTQRLAAASAILNIAQSAADPVERREYTQFGLKMAEIRGSEEILDRLDTVKNAQAQSEQLKDTVDRMTEQMKQLENRFVNAELENRILRKQISGVEKMARAEGAAVESINNAKKEANNTNNNGKE